MKTTINELMEQNQLEMRRCLKEISKEVYSLPMKRLDSIDNTYIMHIKFAIKLFRLVEKISNKYQIDMSNTSNENRKSLTSSTLSFASSTLSNSVVNLVYILLKYIFWASAISILSPNLFAHSNIFRILL